MAIKGNNMHSQLINTKNGLKSKGLSCVKSQSKLTSNTNFKDSPIIKQLLNISKYLLMHFHGLSFHLVLDCLNDKQTKVVIELKFQTKIADKRYNSHATGGHFTKTTYFMLHRFKQSYYIIWI